MLVTRRARGSGARSGGTLIEKRKQVGRSLLDQASIDAAIAALAATQHAVIGPADRCQHAAC
jgi:hypothetical protein